MGTLSSVIIEPESLPAAGTVIWLHGLGADGHDFESIVPMLGATNLRYVFPNAPAIAVTINQGFVMPAWYDILTLDDSAEREKPEDIERSASQIVELIAAEIERGTTSDRILLAGFSQGGAMALHVGLRYPETLRGIMALSSYLVLPDHLEGEAHVANHHTPILFCHGTRDPLVPIDRGRRAHRATAAVSPERQQQWREYEMGHEVCPEEIAHIGRWMRELYAE